MFVFLFSGVFTPLKTYSIICSFAVRCPSLIAPFTFSASSSFPKSRQLSTVSLTRFIQPIPVLGPSDTLRGFMITNNTVLRYLVC